MLILPPPFRDRCFWLTLALVLLVFATHSARDGIVSGTPEAMTVIAYVILMLYAALVFGFGGAVATTALLIVITLPSLLDDLVKAAADFLGGLVLHRHIIDGRNEHIVGCYVSGPPRFRLLGGDLTAPYQFIRIAEAMEELGRDENVLAWATRGIAETSGW